MTNEWNYFVQKGNKEMPKCWWEGKKLSEFYYLLVVEVQIDYINSAGRMFGAMMNAMALIFDYIFYISDVYAI